MTPWFITFGQNDGSHRDEHVGGIFVLLEDSIVVRKNKLRYFVAVVLQDATIKTIADPCDKGTVSTNWFGYDRSSDSRITVLVPNRRQR